MIKKRQKSEGSEKKRKVQPNFSRSSGYAKPKLKIGFVPLIDAAPFLVAEELGLFEKYGLDVELSNEVGWATIREKLLYRELDGAHALSGMAFCLKLGIGVVPCDVLVSMVLSHNGNAITLSNDLWNQGVRDVDSLAKLLKSSLGRRFTFGIVAKCSSHNFLLRKWLESANINPDKDIQIAVIPPELMAKNLASGVLDGFCVGEPWNSLAILGGNGWCPVLGKDIISSYPEKVLLMRSEYAEQNEDVHFALIQALSEACVFCQEAENRVELVDLLAHHPKMDISFKVLANSLLGPFDRGRLGKVSVDNFHIFHGRNVNRPSEEKADQILQDMGDHGLLMKDFWEKKHSKKELSEIVYREDLYEKALSPESIDSEFSTGRN